VVAILIKLSSKGSVLYWSDRIGRDNVIFSMPKFRSMKVDTPAVATHLLENPKTILRQGDTDAAQDFGYKPRQFSLSQQDILIK